MNDEPKIAVHVGAVWAWPARSRSFDPVVRTVMAVRLERAGGRRSLEVVYRERGAGDPFIGTCSIAHWRRLTRRGILLNGKPRGQ